MRSLFVALCVCSLAIAARAQCTASESRPCNGNGKCTNNVCVCNTVVANGVTTTFSGSKCESFSSWWFTNETAPVACSYDNTCNGHGDLVSGKCNCKTYFDGNVTKQYSGQCCSSWKSWWQNSNSNSWSTSGNATAGVGSCTSSGCSGHGQCLSGGICECQKITEGNRVTEYYGPQCNNWHASWWWTTSSGTYRSDEYGTGVVWVADGKGMRESRQEWYCFCDNSTNTYFDNNDKQGTICAAYCNATYTCNNHGTCNTQKQTCGCTGNFAGRWCDKCVEGWANKNSSNPTQLCNVCAPGYYPATASNGVAACSVQCWDESTCNGHGTCGADGKCTCKAGYTGAACDTCRESEGYHGQIASLCQVCDAKVHCNTYGICGQYGRCECGNGYGGPNCNNCSSGGNWPRCSGATVRAAAADAECPGPNLALPIILSILGTLLVMLIAFAIYRMWAAKQAGAGGAGTAKSSNWSEFEKDSSTAYSQL